LGNYNFANLSPYDFELLMRDLLNSAENFHLRAFAPGRDRGIDLRGWESGRRNALVIVQCKHMIASTYSQLLSTVKKEKIKLDKLTPKPIRYILATTQLLTAGNMDELAEELKPYCKSSEDVLDAGRIEELLEAHSDVLRKHYKLWITSTPVLQRVLNAGIYNRSESYLTDLVAKSRTFVQPRAFNKAQRILKDNHTCIISGLPGVGKTTLADMLCLEYIANGFELIVVSSDILEADNVYAQQRKQVFIYDDFLGRTDLGEKLGKNEDNRIVEFIRRVSQSANHRFILTTREHILRGARVHYERLDSDAVEPLKCVLEMTNYNELQKGLILYQHLAFSNGISQSEIQDLVANRRYMDIVRHPNYTPRLIAEAIASMERFGMSGKR
jgi:hypothetical protein